MLTVVVGPVVALVGLVAGHAGVMLIAFYFFLLEGPRLRGWLERLSPLEPRQTRDLFAEFRSVARASIFGSVLAALFQATAATAGYLVTGVPHPIFFGVLTQVASFIPVIGTMLVWLPSVGLLKRAPTAAAPSARAKRSTFSRASWRAVGPGGRERRAGNAAERARTTVQKRPRGRFTKQRRNHQQFP